MKHVLLATTALTLSAGVAAADVSLGGKAAAGVVNNGSTSTSVSGIDVNISASVTTDGGITITAADDIGGGSTIDWNDDFAIDAQSVVGTGGAMGQPAVTVAMGATTLVIDPNSVSDLYDDQATGDIQISTSMAGFSIDYVASDTNTATSTNSYSLGYKAGDLSIGVVGTTSGGATENEAMKWTASYAMGDITLGMKMDNNGDQKDITTGSVTYAMGNGLSVSLSADDNDDWDASATWSSGAMSVTYKTNEASEWKAYGSMTLGGGASVFASSTHADWTAFGVEFTF